MNKSQGLFLAALLVRFAALGVWVFKGLGDFYGRDLYFSLAQSWSGWAPPVAMDATHPPLYTGFIAALLWAFRSPSPIPVLISQVFLSAALVPLMLRLGPRLASKPAARLAALWIVFDPALLFFAPQLQTETLFVFLEILFFALLYRNLENDAGIGSWFGLGALGGAAALCRSVFAAYPPFLLIALWRMKGIRAVRWKFLILCMGWLSPIGVWTVRNWVRYHEVIPISAQMGWTLYEGLTTDREELRVRQDRMEAEAKSLGMTDPLVKCNYFKAKAYRYIRTHPWDSMRIVFVKAFLFWRPWPYDPHSLWIRVLFAFYFSGIIFLGIYGLWAERESLARWSPIFGLCVYLTLAHSVFFSSLRYRLPLEPFLCLGASIGLESLFRGRPLFDRFMAKFLID